MTCSSKPILHLRRINETKEQTQGILEATGIEKKFTTIELPWKNNAKRISCIPTGTYTVKRRWSKKLGHHFHLTDVPNRELILIHVGNYNEQTQGCILVGNDFKDINNDNVIDITESRSATFELLRKLPHHEFKIKITNENQN